MGGVNHRPPPMGRYPDNLSSTKNVQNGQKGFSAQKAKLLATVVNRIMQKSQTIEKPALTEKVMVSPEIKQVLFGLKRPGERIGDVVERVILDRRRDEFIDFLDKRAKEAQYVPIESDPEMAQMIQDQG